MLEVDPTFPEKILPYWSFITFYTYFIFYLLYLLVLLYTPLNNI
jgi:hypothetical protein